jgi:predicted nucleic acid-binding protein
VIERRLLGQSVLVPAHFDAEAYAAIRRAVRRGTLPAEEGSIALLRIATLAAERIALAELLARAFAERDRFGAHDVFYAVLARRESALLVTTDAPLARACEGFVEVELATG